MGCRFFLLPLALAWSTAIASVSIAGAAVPDPHALFARERTAEGGDAWRRVTVVKIDGEMDDIAPLVAGQRAYTLTTRASDGTQATLTIHPRDILAGAL